MATGLVHGGFVIAGWPQGHGNEQGCRPACCQLAKAGVVSAGACCAAQCGLDLANGYAELQGATRHVPPLDAAGAAVFPAGTSPPSVAGGRISRPAAPPGSGPKLFVRHAALLI